MIDDADRCFNGFVEYDEIIDPALIGLVLGGFFQAGQDEDIEIGDIFVCDVALGVYIFDPLPACIAAEKDDHVGRWEVPADDFDDKL